VIIYFVRHGESQLNAVNVLHSRNYEDNPLTDKGRLEAAAAAFLLRRMGVKGPVFSSPLLRARQTARCIDPDFKVDHRLREIDMGEWELRRIEEIPFGNYLRDPVMHSPPGGEDMGSVAERMLDFINYARGLGARAVVAVSHWHPIATAIALIIGLPLSNIYKIRIGTGSITAIDLEIGDLLFSNLSPIRILRSLGFRDEEILAECNKVVS